MGQDAETNMLGDETRAIHEGEENLWKGVTTPVDFSSTFVEGSDGNRLYGRIKNPTRDALEQRLAALENARFALAFSAGMAAISTTIFALLNASERPEILASDDLYGGTRSFFNSVLARAGIRVRYEDATNASSFIMKIRVQTRMIWLESPGNPLLKIADIQTISDQARGWPHIRIVVDNTFASPVGQRPLELGADISLHSVTKYISGHSDVIGGAICTNEETLLKKIFETRTAMGTQMDPMTSFLVARGIKTLHMRMERHERNAQVVAQMLNKHPAVEWVRYTGYDGTNPQFLLAQRQMQNFGGMIAFELKGTAGNTAAFREALRGSIIQDAVSLGGVESLLTAPALTTHQSIPQEQKNALGITDTLIRLSVGVEDYDDIIEALKTALDASLHVLMHGFSRHGAMAR